jgi:hypothetical protein
MERVKMTGNETILHDYLKEADCGSIGRNDRIDGED